MLAATSNRCETICRPVHNFCLWLWRMWELIVMLQLFGYVGRHDSTEAITSTRPESLYLWPYIIAKRFKGNKLLHFRLYFQQVSPKNEHWSRFTEVLSVHTVDLMAFKMFIGDPRSVFIKKIGKLLCRVRFNRECWYLGDMVISIALILLISFSF